MRIEVVKGIWSIGNESGIHFDNLITSVITQEEHFKSTDIGCIVSIHESQIDFTFTKLTVSITFSENESDVIVFDCTVKNISSSHLRIRSVTPLEYCGDWNANGLFTVSKSTHLYTYPAERCYGYDGKRSITDNQTYLSFWFASFHDPTTDDNFFIGLSDVPQGFSKYHFTPLHSIKRDHKVLQWSTEIDCHSGMRGVRVRAGESFHAGKQCLMIWKGDHYSGLEQYARCLSSEMKIKSCTDIPVGWCSWYAGYGTEISEEETLKNLERAKNIPELKYFQIDDGWTINKGTRKNDEPEIDKIKFPHGMKWIADKIRSESLIPGLWIRPFQGWGDAQDVTQWAQGESMDLSHPDAINWLREMIHRIVHDWGYQYIKFDFVTYDFFQQWGMDLLRSTTAPFTPYDDSMTNIQIYRRGLEAIREGAGDECFLLGCNCLIGPAIGIVDGIRIGDDVASHDWARTFTMGVKSIAPMQFLNDQIWWNDPDCIMFHDHLKKHRARILISFWYKFIVRKPIMSIRHVKMWTSFVMFSGGMRIISSKLFELDNQRSEILMKTLSLQCKQSRPVQNDDTNVHEVWYAKIVLNGFDRDAIGIFNWNKSEKKYHIDFHHIGITPASYSLIDYWDDAVISKVYDSIDNSLSGEQCKILYLIKSGDV